ncbi:MAG: hypothetical protein QM723_10625 [Myxococcaceae bacterium]
MTLSAAVLVSLSVAAAEPAGLWRAKLGDQLEHRVRHRRVSWNGGSTWEATLRLRRVAPEVPFTFEATVTVTGTSTVGERVVRWGPSRQSKLFAYSPRAHVEQVLAELQGSSEHCDAEHHPAACRVGGAPVDCEETLEMEQRWKRHVAHGVPSLALSGGLIDSHLGDLKSDEYAEWIDLLRPSHSDPTSGLKETVPIAEAKVTPLVHALAIAHHLAQQAEWKADTDASGAASTIEEALTVCSPIEIELRRVNSRVTARLEAGQVRSLFGTGKDDPQPPPATLACLRKQLREARLDPSVSAVEVWWNHQGPEAEIEASIREVNEAQLRAFSMVCLVEQNRFADGLPAVPVVVEAHQTSVTSATIAGAPDARLHDCVASRATLTALPLPTVTHVQQDLPVK